MSLTDDDKQWIQDAMRRETGRVESKLERLQTELDDKIERLDGKVERVETSLLTEFHKWASPVEMRQRSHTAALRALDIEVESLSDRVKKLEDDPDHRSRPEQGS
jgi:TRAP-type C4-dicarboxylate transport system substrate-binding protein